MPIIRQAGSAGGFFTGAGQAAGAYDAATQSAQRLLQRQMEAQNAQLLQLGRQQQQQAINDRQFDQAERRLDLRERFEARQDELQAASFSDEGGAILQAHRELLALAPEVAQDVHRQAGAILGPAQATMTPEELGRHPQRGQIKALVFTRLNEAKQAAREADIQGTHRNALEAMRAIAPDWIESEQGAADVASLNAQLLGVESPREAAKVTARWRDEVGGRLRLNKRRRTLFDKGQARLQSIMESDDAQLGDEENQARIQRALTDLLESNDPEMAYAKFEMALDPYKQAAVKEAEDKGYWRGLMEQAASAAAQGAAGAGPRAERMSRPVAPAGETTLSEVPGIRKALGLEHQERAFDPTPAIMEQMKADGVPLDPDSEESKAEFIRRYTEAHGSLQWFGREEEPRDPVAEAGRQALLRALPGGGQ